MVGDSAVNKGEEEKKKDVKGKRAIREEGNKAPDRKDQLTKSIHHRCGGLKKNRHRRDYRDDKKRYGVMKKKSSPWPVGSTI